MIRCDDLFLFALLLFRPRRRVSGWRFRRRPFDFRLRWLGWSFDLRLRLRRWSFDLRLRFPRWPFSLRLRSIQRQSAYRALPRLLGGRRRLRPGFDPGLRRGRHVHLGRNVAPVEFRGRPGHNRRAVKFHRDRREAIRELTA